MKSLKEIIQNLKMTKVSNEEFYRLIDLKDNLLSVNNKKIEVSDFIITPYYIQDNRRLELYEYEFNLRIVETVNFNKHLLEFTGKQKIEDVLPSIIEIQKECYVEIFDTIIDIQIIKEYIDYLFNNKDIKNQIEEYFGSFSIEKLFFEIY